VQKRKTAGVRGVSPVGEKVGENNLSVKRVNCDKTKETCAQIPTPYERTIHLVF